MKNNSITSNKSVLFTFNAITISTIVFCISWFYFFATTRSVLNWWIENSLVILFLPWFYYLYATFKFSATSIYCIFLFLIIHLYGAQMSYTYNYTGAWFQQHFHLQRNPYDRFVHFNFGFLLAYPLFEYVTKNLKAPIKWAYSLVVLIVLGLATLFELIEWMVASLTDSKTGETYVATQGDVWDAHKDIALALLGSIIILIFVYFYKKINHEKNYYHTSCKIRLE